MFVFRLFFNRVSSRSAERLVFRSTTDAKYAGKQTHPEARNQLQMRDATIKTGAPDLH